MFDIDDFPYYRDSVLVKRFEDFLSINPEGQDAWVDITDPINWAPSGDVSWSGSSWVFGAGVSVLQLQGEKLRNFFPYGYRFTFTPEAWASIDIGTESNYYGLAIFPNQPIEIFPTSGTIFQSNYGRGHRISRIGSLVISKIEYRMLSFAQDFDWSQVFNVDITDLIDSNFNGFFIKDDSLFLIGYLDDDSVLCSYSNGAWTSEVIQVAPDVGGMFTPFSYNGRKAYVNYGSLKVGFGYEDVNLDWQYEEVPFTPNPSSLTDEISYRSMSFSPGNVYACLVGDNSPYMNILKRTGDTFATLTNPVTLPTSDSYGVCWSKTDDIYFVVAHAMSPYITIYKRSGDTFTKLSNPSSLPGSTCYCCSFSYDDTYLAVGCSGSPYVVIYKRSGDTFTKLSNPGTLPGNSVSDVEWSHDGTYLVCTVFDKYTYDYPFVVIYKRSGDTFTKLSDPITLPSYSGLCAAFSHDDSYLFVGHSTGGILYARSGDTFTSSNALGTVPASPSSAKWSSDSTYLFMNKSLYKNVAGVFTRLSNANINNYYGIQYGKGDISDDDLYFGSGGIIYKRTGDFLNQISQENKIETNTIGAITPFVDTDNNILLLVDVQGYTKLYKRTPTGTWTRQFLPGHSTFPQQFWESTEFGVIGSDDRIHYAHFDFDRYYYGNDNEVNEYKLWHTVYDNGVFTSTHIDTYSVMNNYYFNPEIILQDNGYPIILYPTNLKTKLAIFNGASWDISDFPIVILSWAKMYHENGKLLINTSNSKYIIYDIATGLFDKSDFIYPEKNNSLPYFPSQNLEKTDFYASVCYSSSKYLIYKRSL